MKEERLLAMAKVVDYLGEWAFALVEDLAPPFRNIFSFRVQRLNRHAAFVLWPPDAKKLPCAIKRCLQNKVERGILI